MKKSFLDAYKDYEFVPTRQDLTDVKAHLRRRSALLRTLGIVPGHLKDSSIIEFGPGSGENTIYIANLNPQKYVLVDGMRSSIDSTLSMQKKYYPNVNAHIVHSDFFVYQSLEKFDAVFCEGAIPTQSNPRLLLEKVASFVKKGGSLVITTMDAPCILSEGIRRLLARIKIGRSDLNTSHVQSLVEFFKKDLDCLHGMSRRREDWVIDQIIHPWNGPPFSIADALEVLGSEFSAHGSSPKFLTDWRWYKTIYEKDDKFSEILQESYLCNLHNFVDWRFSLPPTCYEYNKRLLDLCNQIYELQFQIENGALPFKFDEIIGLLSRISNECPQLHPDTKLGIVKAIELLSSKQPLAECDLLSWWGRGQQYLSFIKNHDI